MQTSYRELAFEINLLSVAPSELDSVLVAPLGDNSDEPTCSLAEVSTSQEDLEGEEWIIIITTKETSCKS